jgi:hypothetical protein
MAIYPCLENSSAANGVTRREQPVFHVFFIEPLQSFSTLIPNIFLAVKSIKPQTLATPNPITLEKA